MLCLSHFMYRKHCKCADILLMDLPACPKSRTDHLIKLLPTVKAPLVLQATRYIFLRLMAPMDSSVLIIRYTVATPIFGSSAEAL